MFYGGGCYPGAYGYAAPYGGAGYGYGGGASAFAIVLVLFILLVIVFGSKSCFR